VHQQQKGPIVQSIQQDKNSTLELVDDRQCTKPLSILTLDNNIKIKSRFLNRLAELLYFDKKPVLITTTTLVSDSKDNIIVYVCNSSTSGNI